MSENRTSLIAIRKSDTDTRIMSQTETKKNKTSNVSLVYYIFYSYFILFLFYIILYGFFRFCQKPFAFFGFKYVVFRQSSEHHGQHTPFVDSIGIGHTEHNKAVTQILVTALMLLGYPIFGER